MPASCIHSLSGHLQTAYPQKTHQNQRHANLQRFLLILGFTALLLGLLWPFMDRLQLGRLPGDIIIRRSGFTYYFPVTTSILISLVISVIVWLFRK